MVFDLVQYTNVKIGTCMITMGETLAINLLKLFWLKPILAQAHFGSSQSLLPGNQNWTHQTTDFKNKNKKHVCAWRCMHACMHIWGVCY